MTQEDLLCAYKHHRRSTYIPSDERGLHALKALERARRDVATGKKHYASHWPWQNQWNINPARAAYGEKRLRWIEDPKGLGWRNVGLAHEIAKRHDRWRLIDHTGWYTRWEEYDETTSGIVYALPARKGERMLVPGYTDPNNEGSVCLSFDKFFDDEIEAARRADRIAELMAEESREYDEAWCAGARFADLGREVAEIRKGLLEEIREAKEAAKTMRGAFPALCAAIQRSIEDGLEKIREKRSKRDDLETAFGNIDGFLAGADI